MLTALLTNTQKDTVRTGLVTNYQEFNYKEEINSSVDWCDRNSPKYQEN